MLLINTYINFPVPPTVNIGNPFPVSGEEGSAVIDWAVTYNGDVTEYDLDTGDITANYTGTTAGTWSVLNGGTATPVVRFTSTTGFGTVGFDVLAGACNNSGVDNLPSDPSTTATITEDLGK